MGNEECRGCGTGMGKGPGVDCGMRAGKWQDVRLVDTQDGRCVRSQFISLAES